MQEESKMQAIPLMRRDITYIQGVQMEEAVEIVRHCSFTDDEMKLTERIVRNPEEFSQVYSDWIRFFNFERCIQELHANTGREMFYYYGRCAVCNSPQPFVMDYQSAEETDGRKNLNWRERLVCPNCRCNSRQRFIIQKVFDYYEQGKKVLMYEHRSDVFRLVQREIQDVTGFEYVGDTYKEKTYGDIMCEDICNLDFQDEAFDIVVSNDVFEHVIEYDRAFEEAYRVLKPSGRLIFTVPFDGNNVQTQRRAIQGEQGIVATEPEWYHSNPVPELPPMLVCQIFGWDILDSLKRAGFTDAYVKVYYGLKDGYLGYLPMYFEAEKIY